MSAKPKIVLYLRTSTDEQDYTRQREDLTKYFSHTHEIVKEFSDKLSGFKQYILICENDRLLWDDDKKGFWYTPKPNEFEMFETDIIDYKQLCHQLNQKTEKPNFSPSTKFIFLSSEQDINHFSPLLQRFDKLNHFRRYGSKTK